MIFSVHGDWTHAETWKTFDPHFSFKTTVQMMLLGLELAMWVILCCSVSGKPGQAGLHLWESRGKIAFLFKKQHAVTSSHLTAHSLFSGDSCGVTNSPAGRGRWLRFGFPPALFRNHSQLLYLYGLVFPECKVSHNIPVHTLYLLLINAKNN